MAVPCNPRDWKEEAGDPWNCISELWVPLGVLALVNKMERENYWHWPQASTQAHTYMCTHVLSEHTL